MTAPALAAARFAAAFLLGAALGPVYDFLRPLRPRLTALADLLFLMPATGAWLYLNFAVCRGDIRLGYVLGIPLGLILWEKTLSFLFRPIFSIFWLPGKKILQFFRKISKKLFASAKKWVTIYWTKNEHQTKEGGRKHAAHFTQTQADPLCVSPEQSADKTVVLSAIALSAAALLTLALTIGAAQNHTDALAGQAAQLEQENQKLEDKIDKQGSLEGVKDYAEDELDLVDPDTVVIDPEETK